MSIEEDGKEGELAFAQWLSRELVGYLHINQTQDFFSEVFKEEMKRPDFLVLIPNIGFIAVDVKHYSFSEHNCFTLNIPNEISKSAEFEHITKMYLWYAYKKKNVDDDCWYFISAHDALKNGDKRKNGETGEDFLSIDVNNFQTLTSAKDFSKLFNARIGTIGIVSRAIESYFKQM